MQIHTYLLKFAFVIHSYIRNHSKQEFGAGKIWSHSPNILLQKLNNKKKIRRSCFNNSPIIKMNSGFDQLINKKQKKSVRSRQKLVVGFY